MASLRAVGEGAHVSPVPTTSTSTTRLLYPGKEVAHQLGLSVRSVDYLISTGALASRKIGSRVLVPHADLVRFASRDFDGTVAA
jgi:excisionase family DNA binding protein